MSYLREYIRFYLNERDTSAFGEEPLLYNPQRVLSECISLKEDFELIGDSMELAYFSQRLDESVNGAAWIYDNGNVFEFAVATDDDAPDFVFENLVRDCMEEFSALKKENVSLQLIVKVEDEETESYLSENYGLKVIKQISDVAVMSLI